MKESTLYGSLLPSHPDVLPIVRKIREKFGIPEIATEDNELLDILLADETIDWQAVRNSIEEQVRAIPDLIPEALLKLYKYYEI